MERLQSTSPEQAASLQQRFDMLVQRVDVLAADPQFENGIIIPVPATETAKASVIHIKKYVEEVMSPYQQPDVHVSARWVHGDRSADMIDTSLSGAQLETGGTDPQRLYDRADSLSMMEIILDAAEQQLQ